MNIKRSDLESQYLDLNRTSEVNFIMNRHRHAPYLQVAEVNHAIHHLTDAEAMSKVVERVVTVVLLNRQLANKTIIQSAFEVKAFLKSTQRVILYCLNSYQPTFECDGVHVEFLHQSQVMVHILQTT